MTITWFGSLYVLFPVSVLLYLLLLWSGKSGQAILISFSLLFTIIVVHVAKLMFHRPQPSTTERLVAMPSDWSFPSAHTAQVTTFLLSVTRLCVIFIETKENEKIKIIKDISAAAAGISILLWVVVLVVELSNF